MEDRQELVASVAIGPDHNAGNMLATVRRLGSCRDRPERLDFKLT